MTYSFLELILFKEILYVNINFHKISIHELVSDIDVEKT